MDEGIPAARIDAHIANLARRRRQGDFEWDGITSRLGNHDKHSTPGVCPGQIEPHRPQVSGTER
jgi:hypothetical protein